MTLDNAIARLIASPLFKRLESGSINQRLRALDLIAYLDSLYGEAVNTYWTIVVVESNEAGQHTARSHGPYTHAQALQRLDRGLLHGYDAAQGVGNVVAFLLRTDGAQEVPIPEDYYHAN